MELVHQRPAPHAMVGNLADLGAEGMSQYIPYEDKSQNNSTYPIWGELSEVAL